MEISHEEYITILKEEDKYEKMKDNLRNENEKYKIMRLSSIKSKIENTSYKLRTYKNKMSTYCVKCRKDTENSNPTMFRTKNNRLIMQSKCPVCGIKKSRFIKKSRSKRFIE